LPILPTRTLNPNSTYIRRGADPSAADIVLRHLCSLLLLEDGGRHILEAAQTGPLVEIFAKQDRLDASQAARAVATRLSVPRYMGAPSAKILRAVSYLLSRTDWMNKKLTRTPPVKFPTRSARVEVPLFSCFGYVPNLVERNG
jgi:hypothetical protein